MKKIASRQASTVAHAANIGADRDQSRRHRPRVVSTDGRPRSKNQLSASAVTDARPACQSLSEGLMPGHLSAGPPSVLCGPASRVETSSKINGHSLFDMDAISCPHNEPMRRYLLATALLLALVGCGSGPVCGR